jgi:hypothetical protein
LRGVINNFLPDFDIQLVLFEKVTRQKLGGYSVLVNFADKDIVFSVEMDVRVHDIGSFNVLTVKTVMPRWSG